MLKKPFLTLLSTAAISAVAALSVPVTAVVAAPSAETKAASKKFTNQLYIVRMADAPVVTYDGTVKGYPATKPRKGDKIDPNSPLVVSYKSYLESRQDAALASVGGRKVYSYGYAFSGFAAPPRSECALTLAVGPKLPVGRHECNWNRSSRP